MARQKRLSAPGIVKMERKGERFITSTSPGPHSKTVSVSLLYVIRNMLGWAENAREARKLITSGAVKVDGKVQRERNFPVGLMDVIEIGDEKYRMLIGERGFYLSGLDQKNSNKKLLRVTGKSNVKGGSYQIHFHDGSNMLADKNEYDTGSVVLLNIAEKTVESVLPLERGSEVMVVEGKNRGMKGTVVEINQRKTMLHRSFAVVRSGKGKKEVPLDYVFVVGTEIGDDNANA
ncbi:MAG: 30S ribosomal protein S4e [Candidatus Aenigmarchaeota archaeon]|nr:30S ribosomal protein S4e [Candidatus Aenigmarchaeota archaeon]